MVRYANTAFHVLTAFGDQPVLGQPLATLFPGRDTTRLLAMLDRVLRTREPVHAEQVSCASADQPRWWSASVWPLAEAGPHPGLVVELRDVTAATEERDRLDESVERVDQMRTINERLVLAALREEELTRRAEAASEAKSAFLAMMSHELRTPLTAILGYQELLAGSVGGPINETQQTYLARIKAGAGHLLAIVEEMLTLTRIEAGREIVHPGTIDVGQLLEEVRVIVAPLTSGSTVNFRVEPPEPVFALESDSVKVKQILVNFLSNAFRFTQGGEVVLVARAESDWAVFESRDTGAGIRPEHLDRIFDAFWQVEQRMAHRKEGSGLGLAIARQLAQLLGGEVKVQSIVGEGSTFTLRVPLRRP